MPAAKASQSAKEPSLDQDNQALYDALDRLVRAYQFRDRQRACYEDLSVNECYALQAILDHDGMTQNELAEELWLDKSTTSRLVARMEANSHVRRIPDADDARAQRLHATGSGKRLNASIRRNLLKRQLNVISDLPEDARRAAVTVLQRLGEMAIRSFDNHKPQN
jgi:DNA-binding MarR family transcriptional regulator